MARRRQSKGGGRPKPASKPGPLNAPFAGLKKRLATLAPPPTPRRDRAPTVVVTAPQEPTLFERAVVTAPPDEPSLFERAVVTAPSDEPSLFERAMEGVKPLPRASHAERIDGPRPAGTPRRPVSEEAEALAVLSDLVQGEASFDITETREYVEGMVVGLDPRLVRRLRRGDFAWQSYLDLHGMTAASAREAVKRFLVAAVRDGLRCLLIVHGRGLNSKDRAPVLKEQLKSWLSRGAQARLVLAFATARSYDGGGGALYVLLRRDRRRLRIQVTEGAAR